MARPSIFSKEYERHKKRRKKIIIFSVVLALAAAATLAATMNMRDTLANKANSYKNIKLFSIFQKEKKNETTASVVENKPATETKPEAPPPEKQEEEKSYEITLSDGTKIKAVYIPTNSGNKFKYLLPLDSQINFSINPSGNAMVIMDSAAQNMLLVDINGNIQDITNQKYTYSNGGSKGIISKESTLARLKQNNYVWCTSPKFTDDENIAYLSQLPQARSTVTTKYFWHVNIKNKDKHTPKTELNGEGIKLGNLTDKGIEVILDNGTVKYVRVIDDDAKIS